MYAIFFRTRPHICAACRQSVTYCIFPHQVPIFHCLFPRFFPLLPALRTHCEQCSQLKTHCANKQRKRGKSLEEMHSVRWMDVGVNESWADEAFGGCENLPRSGPRLHLPAKTDLWAKVSVFTLTHSRIFPFPPFAAASFPDFSAPSSRFSPFPFVWLC